MPYKHELDIPCVLVGLIQDRIAPTIEVEGGMGRENKQGFAARCGVTWSFLYKFLERDRNEVLGWKWADILITKGLERPDLLEDLVEQTRIARGTATKPEVVGV